MTCLSCTLNLLLSISVYGSSPPPVSCTGQKPGVALNYFLSLTASSPIQFTTSYFVYLQHIPQISQI